MSSFQLLFPSILEENKRGNTFKSFSHLSWALGFVELDCSYKSFFPSTKKKLTYFQNLDVIDI